MVKIFESFFELPTALGVTGGPDITPLTMASFFVEGGTPVNPSTFGGILDNSPSKQRPV